MARALAAISRSSPSPPVSAAAVAARSAKRRRRKGDILSYLRGLSWMHLAGIIGLASVILGVRHFVRCANAVSFHWFL
jgi:hypothetical protein